MIESKKRGFAIVLVAILGGLVFLVGSALVVTMQLRTRAADYARYTQLARENARLALKMAVGELQQYAGDDKQVTFLADTLRSNTKSDFNVSDPSGVNDPFWTGTLDGSTTRWLVTRGIDGKRYTPTGTDTTERVTLVGDGSVNIDRRKVTVPVEAIVVKGVDGFAATALKTIGRYGFWVGDSGVKASYALYDTSYTIPDEFEFIDHDEYGEDAGELLQARLSQLRIAKPGIADVDTDVPENRDRIDMFMNDFQFREDFGDPDNADLANDRYLLDLENIDVQKRFHDFTPLSKGLLVNSNSGGFREDLSTLSSPARASNSAVLNSSYLPFAALAKQTRGSGSNYANGALKMQAGSADVAPLHPVLTQFNINYSIYVVKVEGMANNYDLYLSYAAGFELWNPFSSSLAGEEIRLEVKGLPSLKVQIDTESFVGEMDSLSNPPRFIIPASINGNSVWRPGQIAVFSGPVADEKTKVVVGEGPYALAQSLAYVSTTTNRGVVDTNHRFTSYDSDSGTPKFTFSDGDSEDTADIVVEMYLNSDDTLLETYQLNGLKFEIGTPSFNPNESGKPLFGFSWEIADDEFYGHTEEDLPTYHPFNGTINSSQLVGFKETANDTVNINGNFALASTDLLLGGKPAESSDPFEPFYDLSLFEAPKQELTSVAHLQSAYGSSVVSPNIGEKNSPLNAWFDELYFSTIPQLDDDENEWIESEFLPNSGYRPVGGVDKSTLRNIGSAENLVVHGMFNVHSTSIEAWSAMLKACPASRHPYWEGYFENLQAEDEDAEVGDDEAEAQDDENSSSEMYLFFNRPFSAEDWGFDDVAPTEEIDKYRVSMDLSMFAFTDEQVNVLAKNIVSNIRKRMRGDDPYGADSGAFKSLQDFLDSGVLENAIADANDELSDQEVFAQDWVVAGSPREFRQGTILNLIAPYLSVRSDTFLVRAYGDAVDPANPSKIWARAYCEAVVQRSSRVSALGGTNREFEIVAFRWLTPSEI